MTRSHILKLLLIGMACAGALWLCLSEPMLFPRDLPPGMPASAPQRCIAVFLVCMSLWFTNLIPHAATGLLVFALLPLLGVLPSDRTFALFGNNAVFFMVGVFLLASASIATGLSKRMTLSALHRFDATPARLVTGVTVSASFLALWMPEHAVAAMIYPIVMEIAESLKLPRGHRYAKKLFLGLAWGSIVGGVGTLLGGARAPLALSLLKAEHPDKSISFLFWMIASIPVVIIMTALAVIVLRVRFRDDIDDIKSATRMLDTRVKLLGPMSGPERRLSLLGLLTIVAWITLGQQVGLAVISVTAAAMLFVLRIADWKQVQGYVNWGILLMYGGAVAIGKALQETQALAYIANEVLPVGIPAFLVLALFVVLAILLTEGISNSAAVAIMLPIGYSMADVYGVATITMTLAITIASGLAFMLPIGSPPSAISYSAGHYSVRELLSWGWVLNLAAIATILLVMAVWWPLIGLKVW